MRNRLRERVELVELLVAHCFAAAYCSTRDCTDTPTAGTAMRSFVLRSAIVFTFGLLLTR